MRLLFCSKVHYFVVIHHRHMVMKFTARSITYLSLAPPELENRLLQSLSAFFLVWTYEYWLIWLLNKTICFHDKIINVSNVWCPFVRGMMLYIWLYSYSHNIYVLQNIKWKRRKYGPETSLLKSKTQDTIRLVKEKNNNNEIKLKLDFGFRKIEQKQREPNS